MKHWKINKGGAGTFWLLIILLIIMGYFINKGIITINWDKLSNFSSSLSPSTTLTTETTLPVTTTKVTEPICTKNGTDFQMGLQDAENIALNSVCGTEGNLTSSYYCNKVTGTWWIDLDIQKKGCKPACVVNIETKKAEINWRCTGLIPISGTQ